MLHALLSATRIGYRRWAAHFNALGWNACFVHLPYHYSRVPKGYWNGELAITANLIRNAEGLRQGVMELRQLMAALRQRSGAEFGILGTSYGGWIGALLAMVERDFRRGVDGTNRKCRTRDLGKSRDQIDATSSAPRQDQTELVAQHFHLSSPAHNEPLCDPERILFARANTIHRARFRHRSDTPKMARLGVAPRFARPFRLPDDAQDGNAIKSADISKLDRFNRSSSRPLGFSNLIAPEGPQFHLNCPDHESRCYGSKPEKFAGRAGEQLRFSFRNSFDDSISLPG